MNFFARRLAKIQKPSTLPVDNILTEENIYNTIFLNCGEPDFDTPGNIKQAAHIAIKNGKTKYTAVDGVYELKKAVCKKFKQDNDLTYCPDQVMVSSGAKQVIYNAMMATLNPGDEVIILAPYWISYPDIIRLAGGEPVIINCLEQNNFKVNPQDIEKSITSKTKWIFLNSPNNPTGAIYSYQELKEIASILLKYKNIYILSDDIYEYIKFGEHRFFTLPQVEFGLYDRTLLVNGVSKSYSMTGWRIGYAAGNKALIDNMILIQSHSTSNPSTISQYAALEAITGDQSYPRYATEQFIQRCKLVVQMLNDIPGLRCRFPEGGYYVYPYCGNFLGKRSCNGKLIKDDRDFVEYLSKDYKVELVSGNNFGMSPYFRLSFVTTLTILIEACQRIRAACAALAE